MRIDPHQKWHPVYLAQPVYNLLLMALFEWGVALHDMDIEATFKREKSVTDIWQDIKGMSGKARLRSPRTTSPGRFSAPSSRAAQPTP